MQQHHNCMHMGCALLDSQTMLVFKSSAAALGRSGRHIQRPMGTADPALVETALSLVDAIEWPSDITECQHDA